MKVEPATKASLVENEAEFAPARAVVGIMPASGPHA
jgi:hypothetical protein